MQIVYIAGLTSCEKGAVGTHTRGIVAALSKHEHVTEFHCVGTNLACMQDIDGIHFHHVPIQDIASMSVLAKLLRFKNYAKQLCAAVKAASVGTSPVVYYHRFDIALTPFLLYYLKGGKASDKLILEYNDLTTDQLIFAAQHGAWDTKGRWLRSNKGTLWAVTKLEAWCMNRAMKVVAVTPSLVAYANKLTGKANAAVLVENATDVTLPEGWSMQRKAQLRAELGLPADVLLLAHVGTITFWDGLHELCLALAHISNQNWHLLVVGDGAYKTKFKQHLTDLNLASHVSMYDAMPAHEARKYLLAADVVPLLKTITTYQLSPIKYYEAMGLGKWLLCTDVPLINAIAETQFGNVLAYPLVIEEIERVISSLIHLKQTLPHLYEAEIVAYAKEFHTWQRRVNTILQSLPQKH